MYIIFILNKYIFFNYNNNNILFNFLLSYLLLIELLNDILFIEDYKFLFHLELAKNEYFFERCNLHDMEYHIFEIFL